MENLNKVVAKNLIKFRTVAGYTQSEIATKIMYSNKSISKWERGEGLPDLNVLVKLAEIYNVKLDDFISTTDDVPKKFVKAQEDGNRFLTYMLCTGIVWLVATVMFSVLYLFPSSPKKSWLVFLYAIPIAGIVFLVLAKKWDRIILRAIATSIICWGVIVSVYFSADINKIWILYVVGAVSQVVIILCYELLRRKRLKLAKK